MAVTKLELTWVGKDEPMQKIEPRLLLHHKEKSYGETGTGNMLIHGDNLLALRALLPRYGGQVKCVYADIPIIRDRRSLSMMTIWNIVHG